MTTEPTAQPNQPARDAQELPTAPRSPQVDPDATVDANGPQNGDSGDRARVRLTEAERAALACECSVGVCPMHNEASDGYIEHAVDDLFAAVESLIAARVDAALAEVEQRIERGPHRLGHNVSVICSCVRCEATHACLRIVRDYRQEQAR